MKTKVIYINDKTKTLKMSKCEKQSFFGSERAVIMRFKLHIRKCTECQELLKQEAFEFSLQKTQ
jgi:hypothetical protein